MYRTNEDYLIQVSSGRKRFTVEEREYALSQLEDFIEDSDYELDEIHSLEDNWLAKAVILAWKAYTTRKDY